jgi:hypothetical protein
MTLGRNSYTSGHFEVNIDGHKTTAFIKSVEGGWAKANVADDVHGAGLYRVKHVSTVEVEPITIEFGLAGANDMLGWIKGSWERKFGRRSGEIIHANFNQQPTFSHQFRDALLTETIFPALDGASKDGGYLKVKMQPEWVETKTLPPGGQRTSGIYSNKQKMWTPSAFRLNIDGIDDMKYTNKVDSFTIKQGVKKLFIGADRFPTLEPTKLEFPNLSGTIALEYAEKLLQWHRDYIHRGVQDPKSQKTGSLEFLTPDRKQTIFQIALYEVGISHVQLEQSTANANSIKRVKFELFVQRMDLQGLGGMGFA